MTLPTKLAVVGAVLAAGTVTAFCFRKPVAETLAPVQATTLPLRDKDAVATATAGVAASTAPQGVPLPTAVGAVSVATIETPPLPHDPIVFQSPRLTPPQLPPSFDSSASSAAATAEAVAGKLKTPPPLPDLRGNLQVARSLDTAPRPAMVDAASGLRPVERATGAAERSAVSSAERPASAAERPAPWRSHTVVDGDTLSTLATRYLGSPARFAEILEANRTLLRSADMLPIGTVLRIPPQAAPVIAPVSLPAEESTRFPHLVPIPSGALTSREGSR